MLFFGHHEAEMSDGYVVKQIPEHCIANDSCYKFFLLFVNRSKFCKDKQWRLWDNRDINSCTKENRPGKIMIPNIGHQQKCYEEMKLIYNERHNDSNEILFSTQYIDKETHMVPFQLNLTVLGNTSAGNQYIFLISIYQKINFLYLIDEWMLNFICNALDSNLFMKSHLFFALKDFLCNESHISEKKIMAKTIHGFKEVFDEIQHDTELANDKKQLKNQNFEQEFHCVKGISEDNKHCILQYKPENSGSFINEIRWEDDKCGNTEETFELRCKDASKNLYKLKRIELQKDLINNFFKTDLKNSDKYGNMETVKKDVISVNHTSQDDYAELNILNELIKRKVIHLHQPDVTGIETSQRSGLVYMLRSFATNHHPEKVMGIPWVYFERETFRVASFFKYPVSSVKSVSLLANSGFVYIGEGKSDKVICFYCYMMKENWREEEDVHLLHKTASPHCPMVSVLESNNVATTSVAENTGHSVNESRFTQDSAIQDVENINGAHYPEHNIYSSHNIPNSVTTSGPNLGIIPMSTVPQITQTQFTSLTDSQVSLESGRRGSNIPMNVATQSPVTFSSPRTNLTQVQTPILNPPLHLNRNIRHANRPTQDNNSTVQHPNINSQIYSIPRLPLSVPSDNSISNNDPPSRELNLLDLGIFHERPKKPEFAILAKREESFEGWPPDSPVSKDHVAKSGIYYEGYGDSGRCFFCGGGLRKWEKGDDPFVEHARWYPKCGYIRQYMGKAFVDIVQEIKQQNNRNAQIPRSKVLQEMRSRGLRITNEFDEPPVENDPAVKSVLDELENTFSREEIIRTAQTLRRIGTTLSSDVLYSKLTEDHNRPVVSSAVGGATPVVASNVTDDDIEGLRDENTTLRNNLICKICMDKEVKIVFLPCGHLVSCQECAVAFVDCPICRSHIRAYVRATIR